jgi:hypothetical protein
MAPDNLVPLVGHQERCKIFNNKKGKRMRRFTLSLLALLLTSCSSVDSVKPFNHRQAALLLQQHYNFHPSQQMIAISLPKNQTWQRIDLSENTVGTPIMLVPAGQTRKHWDQSIQTQIADYRYHPELTRDSFIRKQVADMREYCSVVNARLEVVAKDYSLYSLTKTGCTNSKDIRQISKVLDGRDAFYQVSYKAAFNIPTQQFTLMSHVVREATLVNNSRL